MLALCIIRSVFCLNFAHLGEISLVADQHEGHVLLTVSSQLSEPALDILKGLLLGNVIDEKCTRRASIIGTGDGAISILTSSVPYLGLNDVSCLSRDSPRCKLHTNGRPRL